MKKISIFMAPVFILVLIFLYGCSKDHDAPSFSLYESTSAPVNVVATYNNDDDNIQVIWEMVNTEGIENYLVAWSDSNVFDDGETTDEYVKKPDDVELNTEITMKADDVLKKMSSAYLQVADIDSFIVYFTVSAVYNIEDKFNYFIGPRAEVDSALILR